MVGISETMCTDIQGALVAQSGEGVGKSGGGTETENLFAALLAALSGGLLVAQGELDAAVKSAVQDTQGDVAVESAGGVGSAAKMPVCLSGCPGSPIYTSGGEAALADAAQVVASDQTPVDVANAAAIDKTPVDVASIASSEDLPGDAANAAGNGQTLSSEPVVGGTGTATDQVTVVSVQHADRSAELEAPPDPDANSPPETLARVESRAEAKEAGSATAEGQKAVARGPVARGSTAGVEVAPQVERPGELESGTRPVVSGEAEQAPSGPGTARVVAHSGGEDTVPMGSGQDGRPAGNEPARGSGEKLFLDNVVQSHGAGVQRSASATENAAWRVSDVGKANIAEPVIEQTVRGVLLSVRAGASELRLRMQPEHLGELHLRVVFEDNVLSLDVNTQSTIVKSIIESNLGQLRQSLHSNGVDVGKVSVTVDPDVSSGGHFSRQAPVFQPPEGEWTGTYRGDREEQEPPLERWLRGARMRHAVNRLDLVA